MGWGIMHPYFVIDERFLTSTGQCGEQKIGLASRFENPLATVASGKNVFSPPLGVGGTKMLAGTKLPMGTKSTFLSC